jgi:protease-4
MTWAKRRAIVIGCLILFVVIMIWVSARPMRLRLRSNSVLLIDATGEISEQRSPTLFGVFEDSSVPVLHEYLDAIDAAAGDSRITGIVVRVAPMDTGWGKLEEIRTHLLSFQSSGKPSICYLGYDGIGNPEYYLASACSQIWLVPSNPVDIRGMMAEALFLRGSLDKLKIVPEFYHIAEYKTATNELTEKKFTPQHREEVEGILRGIYGQYIHDAAQARHMDVAAFEAILNRGPLLSNDAVADKIVDRLGYWDQVQGFFKSRAGGWNPISLARYRAFVPSALAGQKIAVIHATGLIVSGESGTSTTSGSIMGGDSVAADLRTARDDASIKAIVLRVDSGGGSVVASEVIRREVELARDKKPVVVSMSDVAASGGYWIAAPANKIIADPNTETGSIGVLTGKLNLSGLYNLLGVSSDYVATSDNATMFSDQQYFTPEQEANIKKSLDDTYAQFTRGVAQARGMTVAAVDKIGKGRVWTGAQGKDLGLVDELGGFERAIAVAKELAHIPSQDSVRIERFPREKPLLQQLLDRGSDEGNDSSHSLDATLRRIVGLMDPVQARIPYELHIK